MSAPEAKTSPAPVKMTALTSVRAEREEKAASKLESAATERELRCSGRLMRITASAPRSSTTTAGAVRARRSCALADVLAEELDDLFGRGAGQEDRRDALFLEARDVLLRDDAADDDEAIVHPALAQQIDDARAERVVCTAQNRDADGVHILLQRGGRDHLRRLAQTRVD